MWPQVSRSDDAPSPLAHEALEQVARRADVAVEPDVAHVEPAPHDDGRAEADQTDPEAPRHRARLRRSVWCATWCRATAADDGTTLSSIVAARAPVATTRHRGSARARRRAWARAASAAGRPTRSPVAAANARSVVQRAREVRVALGHEGDDHRRHEAEAPVAGDLHAGEVGEHDPAAASGDVLEAQQQQAAVGVGRSRRRTRQAGPTGRSRSGGWLATQMRRYRASWAVPSSARHSMAPSRRAARR